MHYLCTLSDKNYAIFGLALYESLLKSGPNNFILYYLCLDNETYELIDSIDAQNIQPISIEELKSSPDFDVLQNNTIYTPMSSDASNTYCFALASFLSEYLVSKFQLPDIFYADADVMFYHDIQTMHDAVSQKSVGIILHRHNQVGDYVGGYNVGIIYFKNDDVGYNCLKWWRDCVMNPANEWFSEYGNCGDQKYLEAFEPLFGKENIYIMDDTVGHGAPWNLGLYEYMDENVGGEILWTPAAALPFKTPRIQTMLFIHFSQFTPDFQNGVWYYDRNGCWSGCGLVNNPHIERYYNDYFCKVANIRNRF